MRTITRTAAALAVTAGLALAPAGVANAAAATTPPPPAPTACAPENVQATVRPGVSTGGFSSYTVRLVADPGTAPCRVNGWPHLVAASLAGVPQELPYAGPADGAASPVDFGPGTPVQFDVRVEGPALVPADTVEFTASEALEPIPGRFVATGRIGIGERMGVTSFYPAP
ncbi:MULTISPECIES: hypothetical protein [unclassified Pseudonocardia]|jgi:hypothetical protein|uniref:hypothetical protein n=1 Tax=unclassified Pseudonocardia TaxID=2619320 RepID=UPI000A6ECE45|nr:MULTISPECIES: hypothetical protein [unclassified Pseudonocardia]